MFDNPPYGRDTWIEVDLDAVAHNLFQFRKYLPTGVKIMAVLKANAYGHGAIAVAKTVLEAGAAYLGVSFIDEGIQLREAGIAAPILLLGYTPPRAFQEALEHNLSLTLFCNQEIAYLEQTAHALQRVAKVHVKVDTGMGRLGLLPEELIVFLQKSMLLPHIQIEGVFTHLSTADECDTSYALWQQQQFSQLFRTCAQAGLRIPLFHINNTAGSMRFPEKSFQLVRLGLGVYGYSPSSEMPCSWSSLIPSLSFKTRIVNLKKLKAGSGIGYGKTYIVNGDQWIATLPVGYGDGFHWRLGNCGYVLVREKKVPIVGRVCMDQCMVDVSEAMPVQLGEEVVLYGKQGKKGIFMDEVAALLGTISYELMCQLGSRVPRVYVRKRFPVEISNPLRKK